MLRLAAVYYTQCLRDRDPVDSYGNAISKQKPDDSLGWTRRDFCENMQYELRVLGTFVASFVVVIEFSAL
jgi:hypothetical protein